MLRSQFTYYVINLGWIMAMKSEIKILMLIKNQDNIWNAKTTDIKIPA